MRIETPIGAIVVESDWYPLLHFLALRRSPFPSLEEREVRLHVEVVPREEITIRANDPADAYPRRVYAEGSEFVLWRDRIEGRVPNDLVQVGLLIEWLWYALAVCCAPEGWEAVHAAAVETDEGATLIFGESGTGKTRVAVDLMTSGAHFLSDDVVLVNAEGTVARGWGNTMHVDPRAAQQIGHSVLTLDFCGKVQMPPPSPQRRNQAPIAHVLTTGGAPSPLHNGPGFNSAWANQWNPGAALLARAKPVPPTVVEARVAITNRNPRKGPTAWDGGDMTNVWGYVHGLQALGVQAEFVPWDELDDTRYDLIHLVHAQYPWSREVAERTTKPLVVTAITQGSPDPETIAPVVHRASAVICYSCLEEEWYAERFPGVPRERFLTLPQGVPAEIYGPHEEVPSSPSVFMAGRYCPTKNQLTVLRACKQLAIPVTFAGPLELTYPGPLEPTVGEYVAMLRQEAENWRGVRFLGTLKGETLWRRYRAAHVHCQPSMWEAFGLCTWEALACGCNAVVTNHGWGWPLFEPHASVCEPDLEAVTAAIQRELRAVRNRHQFKPPTWEQTARALVPVYREALSVAYA